MADYIIHFDGLCQPKNPGGVATYGFAVKRGDDIIHTGKGVIGEGEGMTNNLAEYTAIVKALDYILHTFRTLLPGDTLTVRGDSQLVIRQVAGEWRVKAPNLRGYHQNAVALVDTIHKNGVIVKLEWVPRDDNQVADDLTSDAFHQYWKETHDDYRSCPDCDGILVKRRNHNGGEFYGCSNYPRCKHTDSPPSTEVSITYGQALDRIVSEYRGKFPGVNQPSMVQIAELMRVMYGVDGAMRDLEERLKW